MDRQWIDRYNLPMKEIIFRLKIKVRSSVCLIF